MMHPDTRRLIGIFTERLIIKLFIFSVLFFIVYFVISNVKKRKIKYKILILTNIIISFLNVFIIGVVSFIYDYVYPPPLIVKKIHPALFTLSALFLIPLFVINLQMKSKKYSFKKN